MVVRESRPANQTPTLDDLAEQANAHHRQAEAAARSAVEHAIEAGSRLSEAKRQVGHGGWADWLAEHFEGSARLARRYMRLAEQSDRLPESAARGHFSIREAERLIAEPSDPVGEAERSIRRAIERLNDPDADTLAGVERFEGAHRAAWQATEAAKRSFPSVGSTDDPTELARVETATHRLQNAWAELRVRLERLMGRMVDELEAEEPTR